MKPPEVEQISKYLNQKKVWYSISYNDNAMSCCDAANKRFRVGQTGIPCFDELKSNCGYYLKNGIKEYVLFHCRGTHKIDYQKINKLLGSNFIRLPNEELTSKFNITYGLVNPFYFSSTYPEIKQFFDTKVMDLLYPPYTMTTNAGHHNWGLEFEPNQLNQLVSNSEVRDIIEDKFNYTSSKHTIGILTGNSPESGIMLWNVINDRIREKMGHLFVGDIYFPKVLVHSLPEMGLSMELDLREHKTRNTVLKGVTQLCENGATLIALACNTTQYFYKEIQSICDKYKVQFMSMQGALLRFLKEKEISHFDFLGIKYVVDFNKWSAFKKLNEEFNIEIPDENQLKRINDIALEVKTKNVSNSGINKLRSLINNLAKTQNIIIALTEISILLASQKNKNTSNNQYYDTLTILGNEIADIYVKDIFRVLNN